MHWSARLIESAVFGALIGLGLGGLLLWLAHGSLVAPLALAAVGAGGGVAIAKYTLNRRASQRSALVLEELPAVCELLAICLTAGEGFPEALQRISARGEGPLVRELRRVLVAAGMGVPLAQGLGELAARLDLAPLSRTLDHVIASLERGAPLADVLRTQAAEARAEAGRRLQERASAREVVMLLPLVFLILPITIAFAVFPGLLVIQAGL
jgi:tight adherence protein C